MTLGQLLSEQHKIFWKVRGCMHPNAAEALCEGRVIDSHTIQRKGPLRKIIDSDNHVCRLTPAPGGGSSLEEIGWKQASMFPGYCAKHDSEVFDVLERFPFTGTHEQCVLQAYRSVCNELYKKRALIESLKYQRNTIDRGCDLNEQINRQLSVSGSIKGARKSKDELGNLWCGFEGVVASRQYDHFSSKCYFFKGDLCVTSSAALHTEFDFQGEKLVDMWDLSIDAEMLMYSIMSTDDGGAIVFVWLTENKLPATVVASFDSVPDCDKGDVFVQYCFLNCENTYFSRAWWDQLGHERQEQLKRYAPTLFYDGGAFVPNRNPLVNWNFQL